MIPFICFHRYVNNQLELLQRSQNKLMMPFKTVKPTACGPCLNSSLVNLLQGVH